MYMNCQLLCFLSWKNQASFDSNLKGRKRRMVATRRAQMLSVAELFVKCCMFQLVLVPLSDMGWALGGLLYRVPLFHRGGPWGPAGGVTCTLMLLLGIPLINAPH